MTQQGRFKKPNNNNDDFDLDSYLEEQSNQQAQTPPQIEEESETSFMKNAFLGLALIFTAFLWYHDWSPKEAYGSIFGSDEPRVVATGQAGNQIVIDIPDINIPDISIPETAELERALEQEFSQFSGSATDYLSALKEKNLIGDDKLSTFDATQLYRSKVPISYLERLDDSNLLDNFNFVGIGEMYKNNVPIEYLENLNQRQYLSRINQVGISQLYKSNVSMDYLEKLDKADYLDNLNFVAITEYYKAGVTTQFLDELKQKDLYNDLNFISVIELFKSENN